MNQKSYDQLDEASDLIRKAANILDQLWSDLEGTHPRKRTRIAVTEGLLLNVLDLLGNEL